MSDEQVTLSPETLAALKAFAASSGIVCDDNTDDNDNNGCNIIESVRKHFEIDPNDVFEYQYGDIKLSLKGVKRELGQTLASTGLTMYEVWYTPYYVIVTSILIYVLLLCVYSWTAAEYMCDWLYTQAHILLKNKDVCELGCGLGIVSILLSKLKVAHSVYATDGDDETMALLYDNIQLSNETDNIIARKLYWGEHTCHLFKQELGHLYPIGII